MGISYIIFHIIIWYGSSHWHKPNSYATSPVAFQLVLTTNGFGLQELPSPKERHLTY